MKILGIAALMVGCSAFASTNSYDLIMDLSINGKHVSTASVSVKEGEKASVTQAGNGEVKFVEVVPTGRVFQNKMGILMNFTISTIGKDGQKTLDSKAQILAVENEPALITVGDSADPSKKLSIAVIAKRKTL